jgi:hypothetical protein
VIAKPTLSCDKASCVYISCRSSVKRLAIATPFNRAWLVLFLVKSKETNQKLKKKKNASSDSEDASETEFRS